VGFFDKLLAKLFVTAAASTIRNALDRRNVQRQIARAAEAPAQTLDNYFRNEGLTEEQITTILDSVQDVITSAGVDASMVASASLDAEKLTTMLLTHHPAPGRIREEGIEWPYRMALQIAADALCNIGPQFAAWERAAWHRTFDGIDKLIANQEQILASVGPAGEGSRDERFAHTYRSHILRRLATIDASTFRASSNLLLDLTTVFVQPDVLESTLMQPVSPDQTLTLNPRLSLEEARKQLLGGRQAGTYGDRIQAEAFITTYPRCVIVGLPGSGKTTLLQHLLLLAAKGALPCDPEQRLIPVLVKVRQLDPAHLPGVEELLTIAESRVFAGACPGFLQRQLEAGQVLFLLDGLDEAVDEKRGALLQWIADFVDVYDTARYVVSSRPAGYQPEVFQDMGFHEGTLCEFNTEQIRQYVRRWTKAVAMAEGKLPDEAEEVSVQSAATLVASTERNLYVQRIAMNPLMLSTLCLVQRYEGGNLPNRRVVLYQRCVEGLLFHWDNKRGLPPAILGTLSLDRKALLLRRLALTMQLQGVAEVDEPQVESTFRTVLQEVGEPGEVQQIIANIRDRSGLLVERRPGIYGFSHLTFQEYFAASAIYQGDDQTYDRFFLFSKRDDPQWEEVVVLYARLATRQAVEQFLRELHGTGKTETVLLSGNCLAAAQEVPLDVQQEVIRALLAVPNTHADAVLRRLEVLDAHVVTGEAITALHTKPTLHAILYLMGKTAPSVVAAVEEAGRKAITGQDRSEMHGLLTIANLLDTPTQEAAHALRRLDTSARDMGYESLAGYIERAIATEDDAKNSVGWTRGSMVPRQKEDGQEQERGTIEHMILTAIFAGSRIWRSGNRGAHAAAILRIFTMYSLPTHGRPMQWQYTEALAPTEWRYTRRGIYEVAALRHGKTRAVESRIEYGSIWKDRQEAIDEIRKTIALKMEEPQPTASEQS
jgi:hypothetical protein